MELPIHKSEDDGSFGGLDGYSHSENPVTFHTGDGNTSFLANTSSERETGPSHTKLRVDSAGIALSMSFP